MIDKVTNSLYKTVEVLVDKTIGFCMKSYTRII